MARATAPLQIDWDSYPSRICAKTTARYLMRSGITRSGRVLVHRRRRVAPFAVCLFRATLLVWELVFDCTGGLFEFGCGSIGYIRGHGFILSMISGLVFHAPLGGCGDVLMIHDCMMGCFTPGDWHLRLVSGQRKGAADYHHLKSLGFFSWGIWT
jgi:hypothetical protein